MAFIFNLIFARQLSTQQAGYFFKFNCFHGTAAPSFGLQVHLAQFYQNER
ncbi:hypothetical protein [Pseudoalteromonas marina]|nr:hypothetical protein [Pseudoalteromonas marina]MDP2487416.1 hypothetical protein [Pseudoalteromonas marina]